MVRRLLRHGVHFLSRHSIRSNLILLVGLFLLLPLCVSLAVLGGFLHRNTVSSTIGTNQMLTTQVAGSVDNTIHDINYVTSMLMVDQTMLETMRLVGEETGYPNYQARRYVAQRISELERSILNACQGKIIILTANGYLLNTNNLARSATDFQGQSWYRDILANGRQNTWRREIASVFDEVYVSEPPGEYDNLYFGRTILGYNNEYLGMIFVMLSGERIWQSYSNSLEFIGADQDSKGFSIISEDGRLQASYGLAGRDGEAAVHTDFWECGPGEIRCGELSDEFFYIATRLGNSPNLYLFTEKRDSFFATSQLITKNIVFAIAFIVLLTCGILWAISRAISAPLQRFIAQVEESESGLVELSEKGLMFREMAHLARSYNQAGSRIIELIGRVKEESRLRERAHYEALLSQISPHFICNTVNTIRWMAKEERGHGDIAEALESLGDILHAVYGNRSDLTTLSSELKLLKAYIRIMQIRFGYRFDYANLVPADLYTCEIPIFTLQPLVENAILHGIRPMEQGQIVVSASEEKGVLELSVFNSGRAVDPERLEHLLRERQRPKGRLTGIGLYNVQSRLQMLYGVGHGLQIKRELRAGFEITVSLPKKIWEEESLDQDTDCGGRDSGAAGSAPAH